MDKRQRTLKQLERLVRRELDEIGLQLSQKIEERRDVIEKRNKLDETIKEEKEFIVHQANDYLWALDSLERFLKDAYQQRSTLQHHIHACSGEIETLRQRILELFEESKRFEKMQESLQEKEREKNLKQEQIQNDETSQQVRRFRR